MSTFQHRSEIQYVIPCADCGQRAYYSPVPEYASYLKAYCPKCKAERLAGVYQSRAKQFQLKK